MLEHFGGLLHYSKRELITLNPALLSCWFVANYM